MPSFRRIDRATPKLKNLARCPTRRASKIEQISDIRPGAPDSFLVLARPVDFIELRPVPPGGTDVAEALPAMVSL